MISLPAILAHIAAQNRPNSHGAVLAREIERLQELLRTQALEYDTPAWQANDRLNALVERLCFALELIRDMPRKTDDASEQMRGIAHDALTSEPAAEATTDG